MSKIANLHSLLSSKWLIEGSAVNALVPDLIRLLKGESPIEVKSVVPGFFAKSGDYWDDDDDEYISEQSAPEKNTIVAVLPIKGVITKYSQWCGPMGTRTMREYMERWRGDESVAAVLFDVDSGGGQVSGTAEFADYVRSYPKPVVVYTDGQICSAAYWISSAASEIWSNPHAEEIGSIGTMCKGLILDGIIEKEGGKVVEEYATKSTLKNNVWRELKKGNVKPLIKESLDPTNEKFHEMVKSYRPDMSEDVYTGIDYLDAKTSLEKGLIDNIGTKQEAIDRAFELANNSKSNTDMPKETSFPKLAAVLGKEELEAKKAHIFAANETVGLDVDQLALIEAALPDSEESQKLTDLQTQLTTAQNEKKTAEDNLTAANAAKKTAEDKATALEGAVDSAITTAGLTSEKKATAAENVALLSSKVVEYGAKPGAKPTTVTSTGDKTEDGDAFVDEIAAKVDLSNI